mgnify:FL=1
MSAPSTKQQQAKTQVFYVLAVLTISGWVNTFRVGVGWVALDGEWIGQSLKQANPTLFWMEVGIWILVSIIITAGFVGLIIYERKAKKRSNPSSTPMAVIDRGAP